MLFMIMAIVKLIYSVWRDNQEQIKLADIYLYAYVV